MAAAPPLAVELSGATVGAVIRRGRRRIAWQAADLGIDGQGTEWRAAGLRVELKSAVADGALVLKLRMENRGRGRVLLEEVWPLVVRAPGTLRVGGSVARWSVFRNGYQSASGTRAYRAGEADADPRGSARRARMVDPRHPAARRAGVFRSDLVTAIVDGDGRNALGVGFLDTRECFGAVTVDMRRGRFRRLVAAVDFDGRALDPGEAVELPPLWLAAGAGGEALLAAWASAAGRAMQARVAERTPVGWCVGAASVGRVREVDVLAALSELSALRERLPCEFVLLGEGYQPACGEWFEPTPRFPHGLRWLAGRVREAGFTPGLWLAPFLVDSRARIARERREWLVRGRFGRPLRVGGSRGRRLYAVDTTHPGALEWLAQLARTAVVQWGFRVLQLDDLYVAALPGVRADEQATRAQALRRGLEALRSGAGPETLLFAGGCPLGPAVGVVDAMRVGPGAAPFWSSCRSRWFGRDLHGPAVKHTIRNAFSRAFMHRRLWVNDPGRLTACDGGGSPVDFEVARTLAAVAGLTGGVFASSDPLPVLSEERRALLVEGFRLRGGAARLEGIFERDLPEEINCAYGDHEVVAVFNFGSRPAARSVVVGAAARVCELWTGAVLPVRDGCVDLGTVPAHGCRLIRVEPRPAPVAKG